MIIEEPRSFHQEMQKKLKKLKKIKSNRHDTYAPKDIQPVLDILTESELPRGTLTRIQEATGIPKSTLSYWHQKRNANKDWFPNCQGHPNRRVFSKETEASMAEEIIQQADSGFGPTTLSLKMKALKEFSLSGSPKFERFCASTTFVSDFMERNNLSYRKPHAERRTNISDEYVQIFQDKLKIIFQKYPKERIFNMDETCWKISNTPAKVIHKIGVPTIKIQSVQNEKLTLTAIATIDANGSKLPLWIIAKGKTNRSEKKFGKSNENLIFTHTERGWANDEVLISYLEWIHNKANGEPCALVWDIFPAHQAENVKLKAQELQIELIFVPAGGTSKYQPLDVKVFGELKSRARKKFEHLAFKNQTRNITYQESIEILLESWLSISQENIEKSWELIKQ